MDRTAFAFVFAASALVSPALAQDLVVDDPTATWTFALENDGYFGDDDNYTSGLRLGYLSGNKELDAVGRFIARRLMKLDMDPSQMRIRRGISIAQEIYTPRDLTAAEPLPDQHPYAGYLYGLFTSVIEQPERVDQIAIEIGIVGPEALGQESQDLIHNTTGRELAQGWDNQIETTLGFNVNYDRQRRIAHSGEVAGLAWDCIGNFGLSAGTVKTAARIGGNVRLGSNLSGSFGPPRVRPSTAGSGYFIPDGRKSWYVFAGGQVEAVAHNIFLDNAIGRDEGPDVGSQTLVSDAQAGLAVQLGASQIAFTYVLRTEEFDTQEGSQRFGSLSISRRF